MAVRISKVAPVGLSKWMGQVAPVWLVDDLP
jgi:hypothetical protein